MNYILWTIPFFAQITLKSDMGHTEMTPAGTCSLFPIPACFDTAGVQVCTDEGTCAKAACANEVNESKAASNSRYSPDSILYASLRRYPAAGRLLCDRITEIFPQREVRFAGGSRNASLGILAHARQFSVQREARRARIWGAAVLQDREARRSRMWGDNRLPGRRAPFSPENEFKST